MLARRLTTILPEMTLDEAIETARIHGVAGLTGDRTAFVTTRPCRAPHPTISDVGLVGGGRALTTTSRPSANWRPVTIDRWVTSNSMRVGCAPSHRAHHAANVSLWISCCTCSSLMHGSMAATMNFPGGRGLPASRRSSQAGPHASSHRRRAPGAAAAATSSAGRQLWAASAATPNWPAFSEQFCAVQVLKSRHTVLHTKPDPARWTPAPKLSNRDQRHHDDGLAIIEPQVVPAVISHAIGD
jgi:Magnesium chelatase, subunit ChlI